MTMILLFLTHLAMLAGGFLIREIWRLILVPLIEAIIKRTT